LSLVRVYETSLCQGLLARVPTVSIHTLASTSKLQVTRRLATSQTHHLIPDTHCKHMNRTVQMYISITYISSHVYGTPQTRKKVERKNSEKKIILFKHCYWFLSHGDFFLDTIKMKMLSMYPR